jgi:hypothetical protein
MYFQVGRRAVAPIGFEGALGEDGACAGLEQHPRGHIMASEAGVVEREGVPAVTRVHVGAAFKQTCELGAVAGARCLEDV